MQNRTTRGTPWLRCGVLLLAASTAGCSSLRNLFTGSGSTSAGSTHIAIRGEVLDRTTGRPLASDTPIVVLAIPVEGTESQRAAPLTMRRFPDAFSPSFLVLPVGQEVRFANEDTIYHKFFSSSDDNAFELGLLDPGVAKSVRFNRPGFVHIYCSLHSGKEATLLITPTPHYCTVGSTGAFSLLDLPAGPYILEIWGEAAPRQHVQVRVAPDSSPHVDIVIDRTQARVSG